MKENKIFKYTIITIILLIMLVVMVNLTYPIFYKNYVEEYSHSFGVDKYLIYSIIKAESNFDRTATSTKGARGLMQILDNTGEEIFNILKVPKNERNIYKPKYNVMAGTYYIKILMDKYNNEKIMALAAYNSGMKNVERWLKNENDNFVDNIDFKETRDYIEKVERNYKVYHLLYERMNLTWIVLPDSFSLISTRFRKFVKMIRRMVSRY